MDIPKSSKTVTVSVIDTTLRIHMDVGTMFEPKIEGHDRLSSPAFSFLIEHGDQGKLLYDLGVQKDWENQPKSTVDMIKGEKGTSIEVEKDVAEILTENNVALEGINAIIWSHYHWDHLGDPSTFPTSTDVVVGPGFMEEFFPDGEAIEDSPIKEDYYRDRTLREISEAEFTLDFAGFPAYDYFGDGSFYLINSPGHAIGHMCALARTTTNPDTFIFMGGDIASHPGEFRPTEYVPLPSLIMPNPLKPRSPVPCPGHIFEKIHRHKCATEPFYLFGTWSEGNSTQEDIPAGIESYRKLQLVDSEPDRVFVILAHDECIEDVIDLFPSTANEWKKKGWAAESRWKFLGDFKGAVSEVS